MAKHVVIYRSQDLDAFTAAWIHRRLQATKDDETEYATWDREKDVSVVEWLAAHHPMAHIWNYGFPLSGVEWEALSNVTVDITDFRDREDLGSFVPERSLARQSLNRWNVEGDPNITSWLVDYVEDMVLGRDNLPYALDYQACMCAAVLCFSDWDELDQMPPYDRQVSGNLVRQMWDRIVDDTIARKWSWIHLNGSNVPIVNHPTGKNLGSRFIARMVLDRMVEILSLYDGAAIFEVDHENDDFVFTLRKNKRSALELAEGFDPIGSDQEVAFRLPTGCRLFDDLSGQRRSPEAA